MNENLPSISIVIPTFNSERTLTHCLDSILKQEYPRENIEIIIADGGSKDRTIKIAKKFKTDRICHNPLRTGEAGKAIGVEAARNKIITFIDSDNILPSSNWLKVMVEPFKDGEIAGTEPLYYTYRRNDPLITRYCALLGMNDILCLFLGNYDRYNHMTDEWTGLQVKIADRENYLLVELDERNIPTVGANGFMIRAKALKNVSYKPYLFDVDLIYQLVKNGWNKFAKVKIGIVHLFANNLEIYVQKTYRRIRDYLFYEKFGMRKYPWKHLNKLGVLKFVLYTLLLTPLAMDSLRGYKNLPDKAWFFHPLACEFTLLTYGLTYIVGKNRWFVNGIKD